MLNASDSIAIFFIMGSDSQAIEGITLEPSVSVPREPNSEAAASLKSRVESGCRYKWVSRCESGGIPFPSERDAPTGAQCTPGAS